MRLTCRKILGVAPGFLFLMCMLLRVLQQRPTLLFIAWEVGLAVAHAWMLQVLILLCVFLSSMAEYRGVPWRHNVWAAEYAVQRFLDKQYFLMVNLPSHVEGFIEHYKNAFYPRWYVIVPVMSYLCFYEWFVYRVMCSLSGNRWNVMVLGSFAGMYMCWSITLYVFARLLHVYRTKNMFYVQLEIDWMLMNAIYWGVHTMGHYVPDTSFTREWVWNEITWPFIETRMEAESQEITLMNMEFHTVTTLPPPPLVFYVVAHAPQQQIQPPEVAHAPQQQIQPLAGPRRSARLASPARRM